MPQAHRASEVESSGKLIMFAANPEALGVMLLEMWSQRVTWLYLLYSRPDGGSNSLS